MAAGSERKAHPKPASEGDDRLAEHLGQRIRALRKKRSWTLEELAAASGVSRSMLSQIERCQANPTLAVAIRIARAFAITLGDMVDSGEAQPTVSVIRADDRTYHFRSDTDCRIRTLSPLHLEKDVEFYEVRVRPGKALRSSPHFEGTREFVSVQSGSARISSGNDHRDLRKGDSAHYPADVHHVIENIGRSELIVYLVVTYQRG